MNVYHFRDVVKSGEENTHIVLPEPTPETVYMFCYTSGTTGDAKGAKETHASFMADIHFYDNAGFDFRETDSYLSFLPYAHVYEQLSFLATIAHAFSIGYYSGDPLKLLEDVAVLKPTCFFTVPRILNRIHSKIIEGVTQKSGVAQWMFNKAIVEKQQTYLSTGSLTHRVYDSTLLKKIRAILGGNVRLMSTGAAPINGEVLLFLKVAFSCQIHEGYG